jgi:predicted thioredoxin/glutaredoxin
MKICIGNKLEEHLTYKQWTARIFLLSICNSSYHSFLYLKNKVAVGRIAQEIIPNNMA